MGTLPVYTTMRNYTLWVCGLVICLPILHSSPLQDRNIKQNRLEVKMKTNLSSFERTIVRCCSTTSDTNVGRCFEVNGFGGIHFVKAPCELLQRVIQSLGRKRN